MSTSTSSLGRRASSRRHSTAVGVLNNASNVTATGPTPPTTASTRASIASRGRRQSEAPMRKRSSVALKRIMWTLKYHDFVPDTLDFNASRGFSSSKPEKFQ